MKYVFLLLALLLGRGPLLAQSAVPAGRTVVTYLDSKLLARNAGGENPRRRVSVYLPPGYDAAPQRRYPVLYYLHGYAWSDSLVFNQDGLPALLDQAIAAGQIRPLIVVTPDEKTLFGGSMYTNSATNGPWADFTAQELVRFIDSQFRTLARPTSRGLAGHSMGGNGTLRLTMLYPGQWAAAYALSPAFVGPNPEFMANTAGLRAALRASSRPALVGNFQGSIVVALARAFSPELKTRPFSAALPSSLGPDSLARRDAVLPRWIAATPTYLLPAHAAGLRQLRALAFDWGGQDEFRHIPLTCRTFSTLLNTFGIRHSAQEYEGTHGSRIMGRDGRIYQHLLPFFNQHLDFAP
jgi:S-formylglutathione hydrolase FrmB